MKRSLVLERKVEEREDDHIRIAEMVLNDIKLAPTSAATTIITYLRIAYNTGIADAQNFSK